MPADSDLTFVTNEAGQTLRERFGALIKDTRLFDTLVGYFRTSGFHALYPFLEGTEKIRVLIGIAADRQAATLMGRARQGEQHPSHAQTKKEFSGQLIGEMAASEDSAAVEGGVAKFIEWLQSGKLEIKAYPTERLHAKLYIMSFMEDDRDAGRIITGSSNFTEAGLVDNLEFNVELKSRADYDFAKQKFEQLWEDAVDIKDTYIETINKDTWLNNTITPYQLYLKCLYEYFKDELEQIDKPEFEYLPDRFKKLEYQEQAVLNARRILEEYGGVFLSDVVGLGKTYMAAMLTSQLDGRTLILAPPALLDKTNPGSWPHVFSDFHVPAVLYSFGKLDQVIKAGTKKYKNVIIDEAHNFRTESNITYEKIAQICRGKRVILVTATPINNTPNDILSQIKLFQPARQSSIPNLPNLEVFFGKLDKEIKKLDKVKDHAQYMGVAAENARKIRENVLKYLMVRRTRHEIETYFAKDLKNQGLKLPQVEDPQPAFYQLDEKESDIFDQTVQLIAQEFTYARYMAMTYYKDQGALDQLELQSQKNMGRFMKILLIKRLESSFHAFKKTVGRFITNHERFLKALENGHVYISKKYAGKILDLLDDDDDEAIQRLLDSDKATKYSAKDFSENFKKDLEKDIGILKKIQGLWDNVTRDPKLLAFIDLLNNHPTLKGQKLVVFTESRETADYLCKGLQTKIADKVIAFTGASTRATRGKVIDNFDANAPACKDEYSVLIATEVLSEGVNLHRANTVINYDIPWNPTRLMQRVGRINRVDTNFDTIHTFNFFPTQQSNDQIKLKEIAMMKIKMFITLLGADARILTDGEDIESFELFNRLTSKASITGGDDEIDGESKYSQTIKNIRDNHPDLFNKIKCLPKKARTARQKDGEENQVLSYFRKGRLHKFFLAGETAVREINFMDAATRLEVDENAPRAKLPADFYDKLAKNKRTFTSVTTQQPIHSDLHNNRDHAVQLLKFLRAMRDTRQYTEDQETYLKTVMDRLEAGTLPKHATKMILEIQKKQSKLDHTSDRTHSLAMLAVLRKCIPPELLEKHRVEGTAHAAGPGEVILSEYLVAD